MKNGASKAKKGGPTVSLLGGEYSVATPHPLPSPPQISFDSLCNYSFEKQASKPPEKGLLIIEGYLEA